ncbi:recombinase family protein [Streptomyces sp. NBC_01216]|uniref:recombinase family protein n=1 Tax=Streptomyces sp. NBC_01216 TaxID=2903778 RepID=UPI002E135B5E|nr:recombinase family protein [Streptomyces sp. NBC_01216]
MQNDGDSTYAIAEDFNRRGVMTWSDHLRSVKGKPAQGILWKPATIARVIQNPVCVGYQTYNGQIWETEEGEPSVIADRPILKLGEWEAANKASPRARGWRRSAAGRPRACSPVPPSAVTVEAGWCVSTRPNPEDTRTYRDNRCTAKNRSVACTSQAGVGETELESVFADALMDAIGHAPEMVKSVDLGEDHTAELEQKRVRLNKLETFPEAASVFVTTLTTAA